MPLFQTDVFRSPSGLKLQSFRTDSKVVSGSRTRMRIGHVPSQQHASLCFVSIGRAGRRGGDGDEKSGVGNGGALAPRAVIVLCGAFGRCT